MTAEKAVSLSRKDYPDVVFRTEEAKLRAITLEIIQFYIIGRPQLVGTTSVEHSERLSDRLSADPVRRLAANSAAPGPLSGSKKIEMVERAIPELAALECAYREDRNGRSAPVGPQPGHSHVL